MKIFCWFTNPPRVSKGAFNALSEKWDDEVYYISMFETREERKRLNWDEGGYGKAKLVILAQQSDPDAFVRNLIDKNSNQIHIFCGYKGPLSKCLKYLIRKNKDPKLIIWAERPNFYGIFKKYRVLILHFIHTYFALKYKNKVKAFLPLGRKASNLYIKYGWNKNRIFPFAYITTENPCDSFTTKSSSVNFVYIGRFEASTKGLDVLQNACFGLKNDKWSLTLVGNYGGWCHKASNWEQQDNRVYVKDACPINMVCCELSKYDVCVIPSRYDGWNVTVNEALLAGIGVITTDAAGSDELIEKSGAGIVVPANNPDALSEAMEKVIDDPSLIQIWRKKAIAFSSKISGEVAADYLIQIIRYTCFNEGGARPEAPWLK